MLVIYLKPGELAEIGTDTVTYQLTPGASDGYFTVNGLAYPRAQPRIPLNCGAIHRAKKSRRNQAVFAVEVPDDVPVVRP